MTTSPVLVDTNIVLLGLLPEGVPTAFSAISVTEAQVGIGVATRAGDAIRLRRYLRQMDLIRGAYGDGLPFTGEMADSYEAVIDVAIRRGLSRRRVDYLIVATALHHGMPFLTADALLGNFGDLLDVTVVPVPQTLRPA